MKREWQPGDVAMVKAYDKPEALVAVRSLGLGVNQPCWQAKGGYLLDSRVIHVRPLVVIDPEDREQVQRLMDAIDAHEDRLLDAPGSADEWVLAAIQNALREFANPTPPKPEEPTGLGAVVEDRWGHRFVMTAADGGHWWNVNEDQGCTWDHIAAVRVLSEGVTA